MDNNATMGTTPAEMLMGSDLRLPADLLRVSVPGEDISSPSEYLKQLRHRLGRIHEFARKRIEIKSSKTKAWNDQHSRHINYQEGQKD